jgi:ribose transport system ATP-binding protein
VAALSQADRARLAIARAVTELRPRPGTLAPPGLLVLDQPTAYLPREGVEELFAVLREVAARHVAVLLVSDDPGEARRAGDRVTVLRDGRVQGTAAVAAMSERQIGTLMAGAVPPEPPRRSRRPVARRRGFAVRHLAGHSILGISFTIAPGEILGVTGLLGSGFDQVPYLLFGATRARSGELSHGGRRWALADMTPRRAVAAGIAFVPAGRCGGGAVGGLSVQENLTLPVLDRHGRLGLLSARRLRSTGSTVLAESGVGSRRLDASFDSLSAGDRQKALLGKWLQTDPALVLMHEPTRGVDAESRGQIFARLQAVARRGGSVLCVSAGSRDIGGLCDRVLVVGQGRIVREVAGQRLTRDHLVERSYVDAMPTAAGRRAP